LIHNDATVLNLSVTVAKYTFSLFFGETPKFKGVERNSEQAAFVGELEEGVGKVFRGVTHDKVEGAV